ncbi:hypothetical protein IAR55_003920 [Kwoniella newhampshirensis]|uniref:ML-like domain-containing protein n=1 Tax=Kwoniella newhampshirensis TaxID=1651941 RepID=A0AAW0YM38_9TREE
MRLPTLSSLSIFLVSFLTPVFAASGTLYTDSVTYCAEAKAVIVEEFDIAYHQSNGSVTFSFSLASVENNLNVSANLYLNVYGIQAVNTTLNLCDYFEGVICPLPQVNFTGYGTYPIPSRYSSRIPGIAYTVPNLEGYARIELIREETGEIAACLQATLANHKTTEQTAVKWATGMFTLVAFLAALFHTAAANSPSPAQYRWFDVLFLFQAAAATGLMHLNYPLAYSAFVQNFHWALGLFHSTSMQNSINKMREKTGGHLDGTAYSDVQYINRKFSPYNVYASMNEVTQSSSAFKSFLAESATSNEHLEHFAKRVAIPSALAQNATTDLDTGLPVYTNTMGVAEANAYDTIFFVFLAFIAIFLALHVILFITLWVFDRIGRGKEGLYWAPRFRRMWWDFCMGNALRVCLIGFFPIFIFAFWQFHIGDSGLSIFFAVFGILLCLVPLATVFVLSIFRHRRPSSTAPDISALYTSYRWFHSAGVLYRAFRQRFHFFWFAPLVLGMTARAAFIAFGPSQAWAQVIGNVVVEFVVFVSILACRPHKDRKGDWMAAFLSFCRMAAFGLLVAFIPSVGLRPIPRAIIGFVIIVLFGVPTVMLFISFIWNLGYGYLWRRHTHRIEDGLEVERFVASDDQSSDRPPMMQQVDASTFVSSDAAEMSRGSLGRRTSILEPVGDNVYEPSMTSHHYPSQSSGSQSQHYGSVEGPSPGAEDPSASMAAYEQAAKGGGEYYHNENPRIASPPISRPPSGQSQYYTPSNGMTSSTRRSGEQYYHGR